MLLDAMFIEKHIEKKVLHDYFFISGIVDIDSTYFIEKINQGVSNEDNFNYKTLIKDKMTSWEFFNKDQNFLNILTRFIDTVDKNINMGNYSLKSSWGFSVGYGGQTDFHKHIPSVWSGVIYLNDHDQILDFPEIEQKIKPTKGKFVLFSSFLRHGCIRHRSENPKYGISFNMDAKIIW